MELTMAIKKAELDSKLNDCTLHVNAQVRIRFDHRLGYVQSLSYNVSDWFCSDSTVGSATNGEFEEAM
jgi:hypothetical protein